MTQKKHAKKQDEELNIIGKTLDVTVEKIIPGGYGLAFAEDSTVFVPLSAAGDRLRVRVKEKKGTVLFAEILEILEPSDLRVEPECPYFGVCGGCNFQHISYQAQLAAKAAIVKDCLTRIGKIDYHGDVPIIGSPRDYRYRSRAQWHLNTEQRKIGYYKPQSHDIIDAKVCPILIPSLEEKLNDFRHNLDWQDFSSHKTEIEAATAGANVSVYSAEIIEPTEEISFETGGNRYFYNARSFFQGNQFLIPQLIENALEGASGGGAALDLFCGVGLFSLPLARQFKKVTGVEFNSKAIEFARKNAENARLENLEFFDENVGDFLTERTEELKEKLDFVLLDPPRAGAENKTIYSLLKIRPRKISYVSCDPATLARDLKKLGDSYSIDSIVALDLFPQTHHVEAIARLSLKS